MTSFLEIPAEVKTKFPPIDAQYGEEFYPSLNAILRHSDVDLKQVLKEAIKMPEIMENDLLLSIQTGQFVGERFVSSILVMYEAHQKHVLINAAICCNELIVEHQNDYYTIEVILINFNINL